MKITLVAVGKIKEKYLRDGIAEYSKRLAPFADVTVRETAEEKPKSFSETDRREVVLKEGRRLKHLLPPESFVFALDVAGKAISSEDLAEMMSDLALAGKSRVAFVIGGSFGISEEILRRADFRLSLSKMTLTHQMARFFLMEQIYRAFKIMRGEKYHW